MKTLMMAACVLATVAFGQQDGGSPPDLAYLDGTVAVRLTTGKECAKIALPEGWRYLQGEDARLVLEKAWGNPPSPGVCGMAVPPEQDVFAAESWAVVVHYEDTGHIDDADAKSMDYDELLADMKADDKKDNADRKKMGYDALHLKGWAEAPKYDANEKKLYWATRLSEESAKEDTLNYHVRALAREGVLVMTGVAPAQNLGRVATGMKSLLAGTSLNAGYRYDEYKPGTDKLAAYGIGGLIAGKVLLKGGFFKLLLKGGAFVLVAIGAAWRKLAGGNKARRAAAG